jgi:hydroxymethylbilane synthase
MSPVPTLILGTRRSKLARIQTDMVSAALKSANASVDITVLATDPLGDRDKTTALYAMGDKSLWTGELEDLLVKSEIQAIVHALKDVPTVLPEGLELAAVLPRESPWDAVALPASTAVAGEKKSADAVFKSLPEGALVGTSSLRRTAQLTRAYPHLNFAICRGNVPTRLAKLDDHTQFEASPKFDALILAAAGLIRLGYNDRISALLDGSTEGGGCFYAVSQGAIGIEIKTADEAVKQAIKAINHEETYRACLAERSLLRTLEGGCSVPIGVQSTWTDSGKKLKLHGVVVSVDGKEAVHAEEEKTIETEADAEELGRIVAKALADAGATKILDIIAIEKKKVQDAAIAQVGNVKAYVEGQQQSST